MLKGRVVVSGAGRGVLLISQRDWLSGRRTIGFGLYPLRALPRCKASVGRFAKAFLFVDVFFLLLNSCSSRSL